MGTKVAISVKRKPGLCDSLPWEGEGRGFAAWLYSLNPSLPLHCQPHPSQGRELGKMGC